MPNAAVRFCSRCSARADKDAFAHGALNNESPRSILGGAPQLQPRAAVLEAEEGIQQGKTGLRNLLSVTVVSVVSVVSVVIKNPVEGCINA